MMRRAIMLQRLVTASNSSLLTESRLNQMLPQINAVPRMFYSSEKRTSRFPATERNKLDADLKERMQNEEEKAGFLPNVFPVLSHRQGELRYFINLYDVIMKDREGGNLTSADKELIITAVSAWNDCLYCTVAHGACLRIYSKNPTISDEVTVNSDTADLDDRQRAILNFTRKVSAMTPITDTDFSNLADHGLDNEDAWDIGAVVAFFNMSNRYAHFTELVPNKEFYGMARSFDK